MNGKRWSRETGWVDADVAPIKAAPMGNAPTPGRICEDCPGMTPHYENDSIHTQGLQETPMQLERIYGKKFAEMIEMDDELAHRWDY